MLVHKLRSRNLTHVHLLGININYNIHCYRTPHHCLYRGGEGEPAERKGRGEANQGGGGEGDQGEARPACGLPPPEEMGETPDGCCLHCGREY